VTELVEVLEQPQSTVSRHLKVLREADLVLDRPQGSATVYSARPLGLGIQAGGGSGNGIRQQLLDWIARQRLEPAVQQRLEAVLRRREMQGGGFFDAVGSRWDQLRIDAFGHCFHLEAMTALLPASWVVADIGTGTGHLLTTLAGRFARVIAVEPSEPMLAAARNRPELAGVSNVDFRLGSVSELPLAGGEVDLAIASLVLHHVPEPQAALRELHRCLRAGGQILLIEQAPHAFDEFHERMGDYWHGFEPQVLADWARESGFGEVRQFPLTTARPASRTAGPAPALYAVTARKSETTARMTKE
jgi:ubiquinone/menaquinone biosynthesis C-methylase UbiE/DNA-binding transcriptional ArsR family regulator